MLCGRLSAGRAALFSRCDPERFAAGAAARDRAKTAADPEKEKCKSDTRTTDGGDILHITISGTAVRTEKN